MTAPGRRSAPLVVIGGGPGGLAVAQSFREHDATSPVLLISADPDPNQSGGHQSRPRETPAPRSPRQAGSSRNEPASVIGRGAIPDRRRIPRRQAAHPAQQRQVRLTAGP